MLRLAAYFISSVSSVVSFLIFSFYLFCSVLYPIIPLYRVRDVLMANVSRSEARPYSKGCGL
jgi:hypothetical protein